MKFLDDDLYKKITESIPIVGIDAIPVLRNGDVAKFGVIERATGSERGKLALIGGRMAYGENIEQTIVRHLSTDLGISDFELLPINSIERPFRVQQFRHAKTADIPFDPTKQAISLTYLIKINGEPKPTNEASKFHWLAADAIPEQMAYNHQIVLKAALDFI